MTSGDLSVDEAWSLQEQARSVRDLDHCFMCSFSVSHGYINGVNLMQCRRHAPHAASGGVLAGYAAWPLVLERDWCGDFSAESQQSRGPATDREAPGK